MYSYQSRRRKLNYSIAMACNTLGFVSLVLLAFFTRVSTQMKMKMDPPPSPMNMKMKPPPPPMKMNMHPPPSSAPKSAMELKKVSDSLEKFVDPLPNIPKLYGYTMKDGVAVPKELKIGMYAKKWKFHRDLPESKVFAYGVSQASATVPGPTIEALKGVKTVVAWENHLPSKHILPWDPTLNVAKPKRGGVPTVVHLHGAICEPESDGSGMAWFTREFNETGPMWTQRKYHYCNIQHPGNMWYHDHAMGLTRVNILAGLYGAYVLRDPRLEGPLGLPRGPSYDRVLVIADKSFAKDGSIFINSTGVAPMVHPQWQPEYFGNAITVNGKAWPFMRVERRKYRFRLVNACNSRFLNLSLGHGMKIVQIGSDSAYLHRPVNLHALLLLPSEIADVVVDFKHSTQNELVLTNSAPAVFPDGPVPDKSTGVVMKFIVKKNTVRDNSCVPSVLVTLPVADEKSAVKTRNIALYMYSANMSDMGNMSNSLSQMTDKTNMNKQFSNNMMNMGAMNHSPSSGSMGGMNHSSSSGNHSKSGDMGGMNHSSSGMRMNMDIPTSMLINGLRYEDPATEIVKQGTTEVWNVINLDMESHPIHVHLGLVTVLKRTQLVDVDMFTECMMKMNNTDMCGLKKHAVGKASYPLPGERGWKNVFRTDPGFVTKVLVRFSLLDGPLGPYPFNASASPGYSYHCHMLDHEDNEMMRPLIVIS